MNLEQRCKGCQFCKQIHGGNWVIYGCFCAPYRGTWIAEIEQCPKEAAKAGEEV